MVCSKRFVLRGVLGLGVAMGAAGQGAGQDSSQPAAKPPSSEPAAAAAPTAEPADPVRAALQKTTQLDLADVPLSDLVALLEKQHGIQIQIEAKALEDAGVAVDTPVTISIQGVTLGSALRHVLRQQDLTWAVSDGVLVITTQEEAEQSYVDTRVYPVASLVAPSDRRPDASGNAQELADLVVKTVASDSWDEVGGPGSIAFHGGAFAVSQTEEVHEQLAGLLGALGQTRDKNASRMISPPAACAAAQHALQAIDEALAQTTDFEFADIPLADVALKLSRDRKIPVLIDAKALEDSGVATDAPVTASLQGLPLRTALDFLLKQIDLTWIIRDEALVITTPQEAERSGLVMRVYRAADLLGPVDPRPMEEFPLVELIMTTVALEKWDQVGGQGALAVELGSRSLVCTQTEPIQLAVGALLANLAQVQEAQPNAAQWAKDAEERLEVRMYRLNLDAVGEAGSAAKVVQELVAPDSWGDERGTFLRVLGDRLIVKQPRRMQREVERLLERMGFFTFHADGSEHGVCLQ